MKLSIIIPLYNEEEHVKDVLESIYKVQFPESISDYEIVVVDDDSKDNSFKIVSNMLSEYSNIKLFKLNKNSGKGAAVKTGLKNAVGDIFVIQDADLELRPIDIPAMLIAMHELNVEFVNGSRYMPGVLRPLASYKRYLANRFFTFLTSVIIDVKITDMACGYKLFTRNLYEQIRLKENRFGFEAELIIKALRVKKNNIVEVPVRYFPRSESEGKKLKNKDAFKILWTIFKFGILKMR